MINQSVEHGREKTKMREMCMLKKYLHIYLFLQIKK